MKRKYLPTFAELIDRLSIVQLKAVFIPEHKKEYNEEINLIVHDIDQIIKRKKYKINGNMIRAILVLMLTNRFIWENESKAREGTSEQDKLLKLTHSINGVRNQAKNVISQEVKERKDLKLDCLAAELIKEKGYDWRIWEES
jgi:hypothetical protein